MGRKKELFVLCVAALILAHFACNTGSGVSPGTYNPSSRAYRGHANDIDIANFTIKYQATVGTRLDDCQTCHTGEKNAGGVQITNPCDYCHKLILQSTGHSYRETLNPYGIAYLDSGRNANALKAIQNVDSDGDGYLNIDEINNLRYPGDQNSKPGQPTATLRVVTQAQLVAMTSLTQFLLANTSKQQFDTYAEYKGVTFEALFAALGIDLTGATGVTFIAPDGFMKSYTIDKVTLVYPKPLWYSGLDVATKGADCGLVEYPATIPGGLVEGGAIPGDHRLAVAYQRDGAAMEPCYLDPAQGKINGEGPLRLIVPQSTVGSPDRGSTYSPTTCGDAYDYDSLKDHNAGSMVRGLIAVRIDPMPTGVEEFDYMNGGWAFIDAKQLIIYGHNVQ